MDVLYQTKLTKQEWNSIEKPVSEYEKEILKLIRDGYNNINLRVNNTLTMFSFTKLECTPEIEHFVYEKFFYPTVKQIVSKYGSLSKELQNFKIDGKKLKKLRSIEALRIQNVDSSIQNHKSDIFEYILLDFCEKICKSIHKNARDYILELYTLIQWQKNTIHVMSQIKKLVAIVIEIGKAKTSISVVVSQCAKIIEQNPNLMKYEDLKLFDHQKQLFSLCRMSTDENDMLIPPNPKLILYIAPTGTGKTLSPLGLSNQYRVIFVCVARHIGLALAKSAISIEKKVAFAFGCNTADDIRLHYYAASEYTINKRSGGIGKVDNSKGEDVEIMICDVQSYICAMYYMMAFHDSSQILTYWDEPTISMDYQTHELHATIHKNWCENKIPNMVLSCATLPRENEIQSVLQDFRTHFDEASIHTITSYDCRKSIPIINRAGYNFLPHTHYDTYDKLYHVACYCQNHKTLLRYFDLHEIMKFIGFIHMYSPGKSFDSDSDSDSSDNDEDDNVDKDEDHTKGHKHIYQTKDAGGELTRKTSVMMSSASPGSAIPSQYKMTEYFTDISEITMDSIKVYYLDLLTHIDGTYWSYIYKKMRSFCDKRYNHKRNTYIERAFSTQEKLSKTTSDITQKQSGMGSKPIEKLPSESNIEDLKKQLLSDLEGILLTTVDAHTLTDGPTIYLVDDVSKMADFYIRHSDMSESMLKNIMEKMEKNQKISEQLYAMELEIESKIKKADNSDKTIEPLRKGAGKVRIKDVVDESVESVQYNMNQLRSQIEVVNMEHEYIPNTSDHQEKWAPCLNKRSFRPHIDSVHVKEIMELNIESTFKILTLMGVGILIKQENTHYEEIVKRLAQDQKLFVILTTSDYIYGTNYQFCHGFIGDDLDMMTQQKTLQSMGRIGRNNIQHDYTVRFRNDENIEKLFEYPEENLEAENMNKLFSHEPIV